MARVFVGIPTLNRPGYLREAVRSVLGQTFNDYRVVVSDNNSVPEAAESVRRFVDDLGDPRIRYHRQCANVGEYGQGRFLFNNAVEEYFVILHDDDVLAPPYLERAVARLDSEPSLCYFMANPYQMDASGRRSEKRTQWFLAHYGRKGQPDGPIDVLHGHMKHGWPPISGVVFRTSNLRASGFVDPDLHGNYPFESNVIIRLGERSERAWFCSQELLGFRFHDARLTRYLRMMDNPLVVETMITLFERRSFTGECERRRRIILSRLHRARSLIRLRAADASGCRRDLLVALRYNRFSVRNWLLTAPAWLAPLLLRACLPRIPEMRDAPRYQDTRNRE